MNNCRLIFCALIIFLLITSCRKQEKDYVKGVALDKDNDMPLEGVTVKLVHYYKDQKGAKKSEVLGTQTTDNTGKYFIRYNWQMFEDYMLFWESGNTTHGAVVGERKISRKKTDFDLSLKPFAWIRIRLNKTGYSDNYIQTMGMPVIKMQQPFDTTFKPYQVLAGKNKIAWTLTNGKLETDVVSVSRFDTLIYTISFD